MKLRQIVRVRVLSIAGIVAVAAVALPATFAAAADSPASTPPLPYQTKDRSLGAVTCASSLCHGSIVEWKGSRIRQDEYVIWSRTDRHARAALVLLNERSQRIAKNLGLKEPAHQAKICLDCHAHAPAVEAQGPRFKVMDGVSCEGCHGASERWVASHTVPAATHAQNVARGLYPTSDPIARARLCLSCHLGNTDRFVSHRIMGAGHPRMSFELETFSAIGPAHVTFDADYKERKGEPNGVRFWAVGQAVAVSGLMDILLDPTRSRDGLFPELVLFDCHACHHPMSDLRWKPKTAFGPSPGPGVARLNDSSLLMLRAIARRIDPALAEEITSRVTDLHAAVAGRNDVRTEAVALRTLAERTATRIAASSFSEADLRGLALALVDEGLEGHYSDYAAAEQATMAIGSVLKYMDTRRLIARAAPFNDGLDAVRKTLANDETYRPADFLARLTEFRSLLAAGGATR